MPSLVGSEMCIRDRFSFKRKKSKLSIASLNIGNKVVTNTEDICNGLNGYFCTVGDKLVQSLGTVNQNNFIQYCSPSNAQSMFCNPVYPNEIFKNNYGL